MVLPDRRFSYMVLVVMFTLSCRQGTVNDCVVSKEGIQLFLEDVTAAFPRVRDMAISPDGQEMMFSVESIRQNMAAIVILSKIDGCWNDPQVAPFSGRNRDIEPHYSQDGETIYFASNRPVSGDTSLVGDYNLLSAKRGEKGWNKETTEVSGLINTSANEYFPSVSSSGNLYFTAAYDSCVGSEDIYVSKWNGSTYEAPICLAGINSTYYEFNAFVDPDEAYMIYTSYGRPNGFGGGDLYISFSLPGGGWTEGINLGAEINSPSLDFCPFVDAEEGILYFTSDRTDVKDYYQDPLDINRLKEEFNSPSKGVGRFYTATFNPEDFK